MLEERKKEREKAWYVQRTPHFPQLDVILSFSYLLIVVQVSVMSYCFESEYTVSGRCGEIILGSVDRDPPRPAPPHGTSLFDAINTHVHVIARWMPQ